MFEKEDKIKNEKKNKKISVKENKKYITKIKKKKVKLSDVSLLKKIENKTLSQLKVSKKLLKENKEKKILKPSKLDKIEKSQHSEVQAKEQKLCKKLSETKEITNKSRMSFLIEKFTKELNSSKKLIIFEKKNWYNIKLSQLEQKKDEKLDFKQVSLLEDLSKKFYDFQVKAFLEKQNKKNSKDLKWISTISSTGTMNDKISAKIVLIQESTIHCLDLLKGLIGMTKKRRERFNTVGPLKNLWITSLLPNDRKLKFFHQQPLLSEELTANHLILFYFEDQLKKIYSIYLSAIETQLNDAQLSIKFSAIQNLLELLIERCEQEQVILSLIVNKMGDLEKKFASKIPFYLNKLVEKHPNMTLIIITEVEQFLHRPNVSYSSQYYSVCFLNQIIIQKTDFSVANKLINIYFEMFSLLIQKNTKENKILSALLTGVNRAFPYSKLDQTVFSAHVDTLFLLAHSPLFSIGIQSLILLFQIMTMEKSLNDRFYRSLYQKINDCYMSLEFKSSSRFLNLLYKSLKVDSSIDRIEAFIKRLLQWSLIQSPQMTCAILLLVSKISSIKPEIKTKMTQLISSPIYSQPNVSTLHWFHSFSEYEPYKREPLYANAKKSTYWEFSYLCTHFHPSVQSFANQLLECGEITYNSDPLEDFSILQFLCKFVNKNPKKQRNLNVRFEKPKSLVSFISNANELLSKEEVPVDDMFMYRYLQNKKQLQQKRRKKKMEKEEIDDLVGEDKFSSEDTKDDESEFDSSDSSNQAEFEKIALASSESEGSLELSEMDDNSFFENNTKKKKSSVFVEVSKYKKSLQENKKISCK